jgi:antitoxin component YwqK of YwqJK toxin-antitoxin module
MKATIISFFIAIVLLATTGCAGGGSGRDKKGISQNDTVSVPDTGYTGIKKYMSGQLVVKEVTFQNGVREGLMKTFYATGEVRMTFMYRNGVREDTSYYYYQPGQVFRKTPYKNDKVDGVALQYFRTGKLRAKIGYDQGMRTTLFEEYSADGKLFKGYPDVVVSVTDEYNSKGLYRISLELSDKNTKVDFYRGEFTDNRFDSATVKSINIINGKGRLDLKKTGTSGQNYVGVIASILTPLGNRNLVYKKIDLPYNDLK